MALAQRRNTQHVSRFVGNKWRVNPQGTRGMDFIEVKDKFLRSRRVGTGNSKGPARERTIFEYDYDLKTFFSFMTAKGFTNWNDFAKVDVDEFVEQTQARNVSVSTKRKVLRSLRTMLNWVAQDSECSRDQMLPHVDSIPVIPQNERKLWIPTHEQVEKFMKVMSGPMMWDFRDYVMTSVLVDCGPRIGELCLMTPDHAKLDAGQLIIPQGGKTGTRVVPIDKDVTVPLLKKWFEVRKNFAKDNDWLFINKFGGYMTPGTVDQAFKRHRVAAGIRDDLTPHTMRHYFATHYLVNGGSLQSLKMILGHTSFNTLQIYVHEAEQLSTMNADHALASPLKKLKSRSAPVQKKRRTS